MDPGTIMTVAKIGSMAMSAIGSMQQGNSANAAAQYNAQVANNNAIAARQAAGEDERRMRRLCPYATVVKFKLWALRILQTLNVPKVKLLRHQVFQEQQGLYLKGQLVCH